MLLAPYTAWPEELTEGEAREMWAHSWRMSSKSLTFSVCMSSALRRTPPLMSSPGWIIIMLDPISLISAWMLFFEPWPMASIVMTEPTPMMMPSIVRNPLNLLLPSAFRAILNRLAKFMAKNFYEYPASSRRQIIYEYLSGRSRPAVWRAPPRRQEYARSARRS